MPDPATPEFPSFWRRTSVRRLVIGFTTVLAVVVLGTLGYIMLGWTPFDALFMVVITISGVGFGEVRPMGSTAERVHTMLIIALGMIAVAYTVAGFVQFLTEGEILRLLGHQRMRRQIEEMSGHTVVAGFGRVGSLVCDDLAAAEVSFVVIERSPEKVGEIEGRGFHYVIGDATEEKVLREAGLERARTLVTAMPSDAETVFITLTARQMCPGVMIVARAEQPSTLKKLRQAGANHVVLPAAIGANRIVSLLTNPTAVEFTELVTQRSRLAIEMDDIPIKPGSPLEGKTLRDADIGRRTGVIVIAIKRVDGRVEFPPSGDEPFALGDNIVILGHRSNLEQFRRQFTIPL
ncbi:MAG: potassium channel protein [Planctomycetaceae bacterium]|nr:potassium channel protein [Planctomycetaceae bacterium]MBV8266967.1 potassium channel protein [Planctomycetaceae bacterium]MBV8318730.1 potassium channel protein [Planctomycetaceae bacterium]